jgi:hypothetical protein
MQSTWKTPRKSKSLVPLEAQEQTKVVTYCRNRGYLIYSVPNGGKRNFNEAIRLKQQGCSAGVPDLCLPQARGGYHSLYLELKRSSGGHLSDAQRYWLDVLTKEGHLAVMCHGADAAIKVIDDYFAKV